MIVNILISIKDIVRDDLTWATQDPKLFCNLIKHTSFWTSPIYLIYQIVIQGRADKKLEAGSYNIHQQQVAEQGHRCHGKNRLAVLPKNRYGDFYWKLWRERTIPNKVLSANCNGQNSLEFRDIQVMRDKEPQDQSINY